MVGLRDELMTDFFPAELEGRHQVDVHTMWIVSNVNIIPGAVDVRGVPRRARWHVDQIQHNPQVFLGGNMEAAKVRVVFELRKVVKVQVYAVSFFDPKDKVAFFRRLCMKRKNEKGCNFD